MTLEESKRWQDKEFKFLDTKDLKPLISNGDTIESIADKICNFYDKEYDAEETVLNHIDYYELAEYITNKYGVKFIEKSTLIANVPSENGSTFREIKFTSGNRSYSYIEDFTQFINELTKYDNEYSDTHEQITEDNWQRYMSDIRVNAKDIERYKGNHIVYEMMKAFSKSYGGCIWLNDCNKNDELFIEIKKL